MRGAEQSLRNYKKKKEERKRGEANHEGGAFDNFNNFFFQLYRQITGRMSSRIRLKLISKNKA